jgi:hypothetical protein
MATVLNANVLAFFDVGPCAKYFAAGRQNYYSNIITVLQRIHGVDKSFPKAPTQSIDWRPIESHNRDKWGRKVKPDFI